MAIVGGNKWQSLAVRVGVLHQDHPARLSYAGRGSYPHSLLRPRFRAHRSSSTPANSSAAGVGCSSCVGCDWPILHLHVSVYRSRIVFIRAKRVRATLIRGYFTAMRPVSGPAHSEQRGHKLAAAVEDLHAGPWNARSMRLRCLGILRCSEALLVRNGG